MITIGIDCGQTGGVAIVEDGKFISGKRMPIIQRGKWKHVDIRALMQWITPETAGQPAAWRRGRWRTVCQSSGSALRSGRRPWACHLTSKPAWMRASCTSVLTRSGTSKRTMGLRKLP